MQKIYDAANTIDAQLLVDRLQEHGITARVDGGYLQGGIGELPAGGLIRVVVADEDAQAARELALQWEAELRAFADDLAGDDDGAPPQTDAPAPAPVRHGPWLISLFIGILLGAGASHMYYRSPVTISGIDYDEDGRPEEYWYHANNLPTKSTVDRNQDGNIDMVTLYDQRGLLESGQSDDNFDGRFEAEVVYRDGNMESVRIDSDGDAFPELVQHYQSGVLRREEFLKPDSGIPLRVLQYQHARIVREYIDADRDGTAEKVRHFDAWGKEQAAP